MTNTKETFNSMPLGEHLEELRIRIILILLGLGAVMILSLFFGKYLVAFVMIPYNQINPSEPLLVLAPGEGFMSYLKVCFIASIIVACPWLFYQIWLFVSCGLYDKEKKFVYIFVPLASILFITGALFCIFVVIPMTLSFFITFNETFLNVKSSFTFPYYVSYLVSLSLVFGLAFQTPIAILVLAKTGIVTVENFKTWRKYVFLAVFIIAAIATPPDPISQTLLAIPLYGLFELGLLLCIFF